MNDGCTVWDLLSSGSDDGLAITAPERPPITFEQLRRLTARIAASLNAKSISRNDRVSHRPAERTRHGLHIPRRHVGRNRRPT